MDTTCVQESEAIKKGVRPPEVKLQVVVSRHVGTRNLCRPSAGEVSAGSVAPSSHPVTKAVLPRITKTDQSLAA